MKSPSFKANRETAITRTSSRHLALLLLCGILCACAAQTKYGSLSPAELSDEEIAAELTSALNGLGVAANQASYLMAMRPEAAYVLTSTSTTFSGSLGATYNAFSMPVGYGVTTTGTLNGTVSGVSTTQYRYTDANAAARLGNSIAIAINQSRQQRFRQRAIAVWNEYQARSARRRAETQLDINIFFTRYPDLAERRMLVAAVAPWMAAEGPTDGPAMLERARATIQGLKRGTGLNGAWYGMFSQTSKLDNGETVAFSQFVKVDLVQQGSSVRGTGKLGSGELIELTGQADGSRLSMTVANTTSAINVELSAIAASTQITGEFTGSGAGQRISGTVVLLR